MKKKFNLLTFFITQLTAILLVLLVVMTSCNFSSTEFTGKPPNIVFLLVDDLGWKDLGCYGSNYHETPNIDRLAAAGMLFTNAYASCPVCSPTRASILTGKNPARLNITDWIPGLDPQNRKLLGTKDLHELPLKEKTLAEVFKEAGYATAFFGKWHLGQSGFYPEDQGFDINKGGHWAGQPASYFYPYKNDRKRWDVPGLDGGIEGEYLTDRLTQESISFIDHNRNNPFLLYLSYYNVHTPIQGKPDLVRKYEQKKALNRLADAVEVRAEGNAFTRQNQNDPVYAAMVQSVDESVGIIVDNLTKLGLSSNTIIVFTSDNGGLTTLPGKRRGPTAVTPLRAGKGWLYEGGIRVPAIIRYPGVVRPGSISDQPIISTDYYPTLLELAGLQSDDSGSIDGLSLVPVLSGQKTDSEKQLFWHYPHYHGSGSRPSAATRLGDFKLVKWFEDNRQELYNLRSDPGEKNDLILTMPDKAKALSQSLEQWQKDIGAKKPSNNPEYVTPETH